MITSSSMDQLLSSNPWAPIALALWTIPWKGYALWKSAQKGEKWWFIILLIVNSFALLEILYIFVFSTEKFRKQWKKLLAFLPSKPKK